jgi:hypothetical protein
VYRYFTITFFLIHTWSIITMNVGRLIWISLDSLRWPFWNISKVSKSFEHRHRLWWSWTGISFVNRTLLLPNQRLQRIINNTRLKLVFIQRSFCWSIYSEQLIYIFLMCTYILVNSLILSTIILTLSSSIIFQFC